MPQIIFTTEATADLVRLRSFLKTKNPEAAKRATLAIKQAISGASSQPNRFRPVPALMHYREIIIDFGNNGYIVRFRYEQDGDIYIVRIKHQKEDTF